jgi:hypothetical protein
MPLQNNDDRTSTSSISSTNSTSIVLELKNGWKAVQDEDTGDAYYFNDDGAVSWERPDDAGGFASADERRNDRLSSLSIDGRSMKQKQPEEDDSDDSPLHQASISSNHANAKEATIPTTANLRQQYNQLAAKWASIIKKDENEENIGRREDASTNDVEKGKVGDVTEQKHQQRQQPKSTVKVAPEAKNLHSKPKKQQPQPSKPSAVSIPPLPLPSNRRRPSSTAPLASQPAAVAKTTTKPAVASTAPAGRRPSSTAPLASQPAAIAKTTAKPAVAAPAGRRAGKGEVTPAAAAAVQAAPTVSAPPPSVAIDPPTKAASNPFSHLF